ncbi:MAG: hypothetical protein WC603_01125 [Candidatus Paceibacterota bacterium]|jgi:hypothetical protein
MKFEQESSTKTTKKEYIDISTGEIKTFELEEPSEDFVIEEKDLGEKEKIFRNKFLKWEKESYITPENFKKVFEEMLSDNNLFYRYGDRMNSLLSFSIDEMEIFEEYSDEESDDKILKELEKLSGSYLNEIFSIYKHSTFSKKIKILSFLEIFYIFGIFNNISYAKQKVSSFFIETINEESGPSGNYYIFSYLDALKNGEKSRTYEQMSPNTFFTEKFVIEERGTLKGTHRPFTTKPEDFKKVQELIDTLDKIKSQGKEQEDKFGNTIDEKLKALRLRTEECLNKLFCIPLGESSFRPHMKKGNENDNFFDHNFFQNQSIRKRFEEKSGFTLEETTLPEQYNYFEYTKEITNKESDEFFRFLKKFGVNAFRTFLSIEQGGKEMGDKILNLGEKLPENVAQKVFAKYGEIINTVDNCEGEIRKIFGEKDIQVRVLISVKETLLKRGVKLLSDLGDRALSPNFVVNSIDILKELDEIKAETILLGTSYVKLYKEGISVPIEDVTETEEISVGNLTKEQKQELMKVYINGRPKVTYENKEHLELLKKEFEEELNTENVSVFNVRFNGDVIIFAIVDKKDKDNIYLSGFTFIDEVRNPIIAEASMNCMSEKFKNYNIKALVDSKNPILAMYQKRFGFKIVKELPREENAGELYYEIERTKELTLEKRKEVKKVA